MKKVMLPADPNNKGPHVKQKKTIDVEMDGHVAWLNLMST
jgi:hypothetical protein